MKKHMHSIMKSKSTFIVLLFFTAYFALGTLIYDDYGVSWDEMFQNDKARLNLDYITGKNTNLMTYPDRHYSAILAIPLYLAGESFNDTRLDYLFRHFITFLIFFISSVFFYKISKRLRVSITVSLIGTAIYIFHPHIFSHSFYNIKDIPFLSLYLICIYTLIVWIEDPTFNSSLLHGLVSGLLVVLRLPGLMIWAVTFVIWILILAKNWGTKKEIFWLGFIYALACFSSLYIFMPSLWANPIDEIRGFFSMDLFTWTGKELFLGNYLTPDIFPRYYLPIYLFVTTPLLFTALFTIGTMCIVGDTLSSKKLPAKSTLIKIAIMISFYGPVTYIMIARPIIYNGWRHAFFVYGPFAIITMIALDRLVKWIASWNRKWLKNGFFALVYLSIFIQAIILTRFLIVSHPYEHVYYNIFAGNNLNEARTQFSMDYWGLAYRGGLELILENDQRSGKIRVSGLERNLVEENWKILPSDQRDRIQVVGPKKEADYFLSHQTYQFDASNEFRTLWKSIEVLGAAIHKIYKYK